MRRIFAVAAATAALFAFGPMAPAQAQTESKTIVEIASADPQLSTLVTAVTAAKLADTLSGDGPFTVFAPTNDAFKALPAGTLDSLLKDPEGALADILKLHVISGAVDSKAAIAAAGGTVDSLGGPISVELKGSDLFVGGAKVTTADIKAKNGIIHVIDAVITKPAEATAAGGATDTVADTAAAADAPTAVQTGDDGLAASSSGTNPALLIVGAFALIGVAASSASLVRARRRH